MLFEKKRQKKKGEREMVKKGISRKGEKQNKKPLSSNERKERTHSSTPVEGIAACHFSSLSSARGLPDGVGTEGFLFFFRFFAEVGATTAANEGVEVEKTSGVITGGGPAFSSSSEDDDDAFFSSELAGRAIGLEALCFFDFFFSLDLGRGLGGLDVGEVTFQRRYPAGMKRTKRRREESSMMAVRCNSHV